MKIEKINDNQIRCTLTRADLAERQLHLSELAYGTEKARSLFHDMMQQAANEFGFEADDIPLMIEAIPASSDSIVLIITKVEDPDELDTRFSKFAPSPSSGDAGNKGQEALDKLEGAETLLDLLGKVKEKMDASKQASVSDTSKAVETEAEEEIPDKLQFRLFSFVTMDNLLKAAKILAPLYKSANTLYKDNTENMFILSMAQGDSSVNDFNRICNMLTEYGNPEKTSSAFLAFLEEHCDALLVGDAIEQLSKI